MQANALYQNAVEAKAAIDAHDYEAAAVIAGRSLGTLPSMYSMGRDSVRMFNAFRQGGARQLGAYLAACFTGETPINTKRGAIRFDELTDQDEVLARHDVEPNGSLEFKHVEEIFRTFAPIWHLHVRDQVLRTTSEHPFWVRGKGWTAARELQPGDLLSSHDGQWIAVEECIDAGYEEAVYNCRVADYHTYFVGNSETWGFDVWAHNQCLNSIIGDNGELKAKDYVNKLPGYTVIGSVQNPSRHGIDIVARNADGKLVFFEVKASMTGVAPALSVAQGEGAQFFVWSRLNRAANGSGAWATADPKVIADAQKLVAELKKTALAAGVHPKTLIQGFVVRVTNLWSSTESIASSAW